MTRGRVVLLSLGGALVVGAALSALATADVVARGQLVPSGGAGVRRVRVWDALEFYISSETARPTLDVLTTIALAMLAATMAFAAILLARGNVRHRHLLCFSIAAAGAAFLAADELLAIHESIGHNLQFLRSIPGVERPDDLVLMSYALPVGVYAWFFRDVLRSTRAVWLFAAAVACAATASIMDLAGIGEWEERTEVITAILVAVGFVWLAAVSVSDALESGRAVSSDHG